MQNEFVASDAVILDLLLERESASVSELARQIPGDGHGGASAADAADGTGAGGTGAGEGPTRSAKSPVFADVGRAAKGAAAQSSPTWRSLCGDKIGNLQGYQM